MTRSTAKSNNHGFSLIEILIFVSVFSVALVALIGSAAYSSLIMSDASYKLMATRYSEELAEWLKFQREFTSYSAIENKATQDGVTYCFNEEDIDWPNTSGECNDQNLGNFFKREAFFRNNADNSIQVMITTSYQLLNRSKAATLEMVFNDY